MNHLTPIERECEEVLSEIIDYMAAGHPLRHHDHAELMDKMRKAVARLRNKDGGCVLGEHAGGCHCTPSKMDHPHLRPEVSCSRPGCRHSIYENNGGH